MDKLGIVGNAQVALNFILSVPKTGKNYLMYCTNSFNQKKSDTIETVHGYAETTMKKISNMNKMARAIAHVVDKTVHYAGRGAIIAGVGGYVLGGPLGAIYAIPTGSMAGGFWGFAEAVDESDLNFA